jgi:hypothetical protein
MLRVGFDVTGGRCVGFYVGIVLTVMNSHIVDIGGRILFMLLVLCLVRAMCCEAASMMLFKAV